jgi:Ca2+-binding RTX toxin-like protein
MKIHGTGKADHLVGTAASDTISGGVGNDWLEGGAGDDFLLGGDGADKFVIRSGGGHDVIQDFDPNAGDRMLVDWYGSYSDITYLGQLTDGLTFQTPTGGNIHVSIGDINGDGMLDTTISNDSGDSITALNHSDLWGWSLMGG